MIRDLSPEERMVENQPKISVLVPVHNTEDLFERCLKSILNQTYANLEIIVVSDCSPGNIRELIQPYLEADRRVNFIEHEKNQGVFATRMTAFRHASGEYIACVDSDDYLGVDFYRRLMRTALQTGADMVCGNMVVVDEINDRKSVNILNRPTGEILEGKDVFKAYMRHARNAFHWVVLWNKLYHRSVWEKAQEDLEIVRHFLNYEDVYQTMLLHFYANRYTSVEYEGYFYIRNINSTTSISGNKKKFIKLIGDLRFSFGLMETFLEKKQVLEQHRHDLALWMEREVFSYSLKIKGTLLAPHAKLELINYLKKTFSVNKIPAAENTDNYFYSYERPASAWLEETLQHIYNSERTRLALMASQCLVSPVCKREDEYHLLCLGTDLETTDFPMMRMWAETVAKAMKPHTNIGRLDKVYALLRETGLYPEDSLTDMKRREVTAYGEIRYLHGELLEFMHVAASAGKTIAVINDTVHNKETLNHALVRMVEDEEIATRSISVCDLEEFAALDQETILEITPDPEVADSEKGRIYYPGIHKHMQTAMDYLGFVRQKNKKWQVAGKSKNDELLVRLLVGLVQKRYYGTLQNENCLDSDFLGKPNLYGYLPVGFYLLGACLWLRNHIVRSGIKQLIVDSDIYDTLSVLYEELFGAEEECSLVCAEFSKRDMLKALCTSAEDLFRIPHYYDIKEFSSAELYDILDVPSETRTQIQQVVPVTEEEFRGETEFYDLLLTLESHKLNLVRGKAEQIALDFDGATTAYLSYGYCRLTESFFQRFRPETGRLYLHADSEERDGMTYYENRDVVWSARIEMYFLNPLGRTVVLDYRKSLGAADVNRHTINQYLLHEMSRGIMLLASDFKATYSKYAEYLGDKTYGLDRALQRLLFSDLEVDKRLFKYAEYMDAGKSISIFHLWKRELAERKQMDEIAMKELNPSLELGEEPTFLYGRSSHQKALFYLLYNRVEFKQRFKTKFAAHPRFLQFTKNTYSLLRRIRHLV